MLRSDDPPRRPRNPVPLDAISAQRLGEFYLRHHRQLSHGITRHSQLRPQDRDEVLSDAMLGLAQKKLDPNRSPFSLAYTIALRRARTKLRQIAAARSRTAPASLSEDMPDDHPSGEAEVDANERRASVRLFLDSLHPTDRRIVEARHIDDLTWGEIATLVHLPKTSVIRRHLAIVAEARRTLTAWR